MGERNSESLFTLSTASARLPGSSFTESSLLRELCGVTHDVVNHSSDSGFVAIEFDLPFVGDEDYLQLLVPDSAFLVGEDLGDDLSQVEDFVAQPKVSAFYPRRVEYLLR